MRRPTKASSAGSTSGQASRLASFFGAFAVRDGSFRGDGSGAPSAVRRVPLFGLVATLTLAALALAAGPARAEVPQLVSSGSLSASPRPVGVAVDNSCARQVPPLTGTACTGFDASAGDIYVAGLVDFETFTPAHIDKFSPAGSLLAPSPFGGAIYGAAAVNPTSGDVYALEALNLSTFAPAVNTYDPDTGQLLSSFPVPLSANFFGMFTVVQIATDSAGNVYVPVMPANEVLKYDPSGTLLHTFTGSGTGTLKEPTGVALDASDNLWVADSGNDRIVEMDGSTDTLLAEIESEGVSTLAVDTQGDIFAILNNSEVSCGSITPPCSHLVKYGPSGARLADIGAGEIGQPQQNFEFNMVAVSDETGRVYVADPISERVWIFGPPVAPTIENELATEVKDSTATLGAVIKPGGVAGRYRFEYGPTSAYGHSTPSPDGYAGGGVAARTIWASVSGLAPETTYHYRVVVSNPLGQAVGPDRTFTTGAAATCPNEDRRTSFSADLPDCRAYEMVTPPTSTSAEPDTAQFLFVDGGGVAGNLAAVDGDRMSYLSAEPMPEATSSGYDYLATRSSTGWTSEAVSPLQSYTGDRCADAHPNEVSAYSSNLTLAVATVGRGQLTGEAGFSSGCGAEGLQIVEGEPLGVVNLLLRDNTSGEYRLLNAPPAGVTPADAHLAGASADLSKVVFTERARLTENALEGADNLYEWDEGDVRLVTVLPDGTPVAGTPVARGVSAEGKRVLFTAEGNLYVRIDGRETIQLDEPGDGSGPGGGGVFQGANADGTVVYFTDDASAGLTADTEPGSGANLYRYSEGHLVDLTAAEHAEVVDVSGVSADGSYVYFVAEAALSEAQANEHGETPEADAANLYRWHGGHLAFIAGLNPGGTELHAKAAGGFLAFTTKVPLTGYDNTDATTGTAVPEIFLYDAATGGLRCVSCDPSGVPPASGGAQTAASGVRHLISSGRLFFQTEEALLPRDTNGQMDVYEYEEGRLHLISAGTSRTRSWLLDASESGDDVFFLSRASLLPGANPAEALVIYDARVGGGFPDPVPAADCTGDACQGPLSAPPAGSTPGSSLFGGAGNVNEGTRSTISGLRKLSSSDRSTLAKGGKARLRLKVNRSGTVTLAGTAKVGKKNRRVVRSSAKARKAGAVSIPFALSKSARAQLRSKRSLTVRLVVRFKDARPKVVRFTLKSATSKKGGRS